MADDLIELNISVKDRGMKQAVTTVSRLERELTRAVKAIDAGTISQKRFNDVLSSARQQYKNYAGNAGLATININKFVKEQKRAVIATKEAEAAAKAAAEAEKRHAQALRDMQSALAAQRKAQEDNTASLGRMRASYDSVYREEQKSLQLKKLLRQEIANGNMTLRQAGAELLKYRQSLQQANIAQVAATKGSNRFGVVTQQAGYQIGDFLVQVQSGTNYMVAFGQQATQLVGILPLLAPPGGKFMGLGAGALIGLSAALGVAIPLVTAIGAALMRASGNAKDAETVFNNLSESISSVTEVNKDFERVSENSMRVAKEGASALLEVLKSVRAEQLQISLDAAIDSFGISSALQALDTAASEIFSAEAMSGLGRTFTEIREEMEATTKVLGLSATQARELEVILKSIGGTTREEIAASFFAAVEKIAEANLLTDETKALIDKLAISLGAVDEAYKEIDSKAASLLEKMEAALRVDLKGVFDKAAASVSTMNARLDLTLGKIRNILSAVGSIGLDTIAIQAETKALQAGATLAQAKIEAQIAQRRAQLSQAGEIGALGEAGLIAYRKALEENAAAQEALTKEIDARTAATKSGTKADKEAEKAAEQLRKELEGPTVSAVESVSDAFGEFITRGMTDFRGFVKQILGSFQSMIAQMIAIAARNRIMLSLGLGGITPGMAAAGQVAGIGSAAFGGPLGGILGTFGGGGAAGTGILGGIGAIGQGLSSGFMTSVYGGLGGMTGAISGGLSAGGLGGVATAIGAVAAPLLAVAAVFSFFKKKVKELDSGLTITVKNMETLVRSFSVIQTKRFWGLSKKVTTTESAVSAEIADPIAEAVGQFQGEIVKAAGVLGIASEAFDNFFFEMKLSLKGLTEEQRMERINEELIKMGDAFASLSGHFETMNELLEAANQRMQLQNRLDQLLGNNAAILARQREAELSAMHEINRPLAQAIYQLEDAQVAVQNAQAAVQNAFAGLRASIDVVVADLRSKLSLANEAVNRSRSIVTQLQSALSGRFVSSGVEPSLSRRGQALNFLEGGNFSDEEALKEALSVVQEPTEDLFGSFVDYARDFYNTSNVISQAKKLAEGQLSADEEQVRLIEEQIEQAELQYQVMVDQYNALLGVDTSVKSVSQAILALASAISAQAAAQAAEQAAAQAAEQTSTVKQDPVKKTAEQVIDQLYASGGYSKTSSDAIYDKWVQYAKTYGNVAARDAWVSQGNKGTTAAFANGGSFGGGVRMVGERGPEIETTGPARIFSTKQTAEMFRDPELKDAVRSLKEEVSGLRSEQRQIQMDISKYTKRSYDIERKWDVEGLPATRT